MSLTSIIDWRIAALRQQYYKWYWKIASQFHSSREKVDSVSLIVTGRNDNYGGDFSDRLRVTLDWNLEHLPNPELIY
ncbi:MAG: hypothetical protein IH946_03585, partial [Bacteroidetes bacterium]|nr:hypothetical protein [Bacteroidota bacterium]